LRTNLCNKKSVCNNVR